MIDPTNPYVLIPHLLCAAREQPLSDEEVATYWPEASETVLGLEATGELRRRGSLLHHAGHERPTGRWTSAARAGAGSRS